ncbi:MAG: SGNH/GDSL hydrolase family protein [Syntrophothermus sp.]
MRIKYIFFLVLSFGLFVFNGCKKDDATEPALNTGTANFSKFVTIGNSITAGYQSGSLFKSAQVYSYGNLIAAKVGTSFEQPYIADPGTAGRMELTGLTSTGDPIIFYNTVSGQPENTAYAAPYNNLGVPGATLYDVLGATKSADCFAAINGGGANANPMFDLILRNSALNIGSQYKQAKALKATFVTLWIGNNDVLGYATSGGTSPAMPLPAANFTALYKATLDSLSTLGAGVVVANIPNVTDIPFFTTIGPALLKKGYPKYVYAQGSDKQVRLMSLANNYLTLKASALLTTSTGAPTGIGLSPANPFPSAVVLDSAEVTTAVNAVNNFNASIATLAAAKGFAVVDINTFFSNFKKADATGGTVVDGLVFKTDYISGGIFSLDGVHPSSRAQGLIANEFIRVINAKYGSNISSVKISTITPNFQKALPMTSFGIPVLPKGTFDNLLF